MCFPHTIFHLITPHTPISTQSSNFSFQIKASVLFVYFFINAYVVGTQLNCIDLSMQFKWVPRTYAFIKKIRQKKLYKHHKISPLLIFFFSVSLVDRSQLARCVQLYKLEWYQNKYQCSSKDFEGRGVLGRALFVWPYKNEVNLCYVMCLEANHVTKYNPIRK